MPLEYRWSKYFHRLDKIMATVRIHAAIILETSGERIFAHYTNPKMFNSVEEELNFERRDLPKHTCYWGEFLWITGRYSCFYETKSDTLYYVVVAISDENEAKPAVHSLLGWLIQSTHLLRHKNRAERHEIETQLQKLLSQIIESPLDVNHDADEGCAIM